MIAAYLANVPMNSTAIGLIVDGLDGNVNILRWGFHYQVAGFDVWMGEMIFAEYSGAAEPPVRCGESHRSGLAEPHK